ncbi:glycosyltransferase family 4 protein [Rhodomicrobium sp. Az07]|uniref:glycosyltransferase family 4 protein n=1 Tax=Rhodomicrobium sp. Az07 TaxID=2839034 RepID=UPI001BE5E39F|nr:glycosyltransferase family 4 protein [Rhodomicrobium sp. Az07]MBT3071909.1 glycosyltransferase family 4 protein [Rhodomicrobium sp. Az07]
MIKIGVNHSGYPVQRNIMSLQHRDVVFKKCYDLFKVPEYLIFRASNRSVQLLLNSFCDFGANRSVDLYHFFNVVSLSAKPWISTFETIVPRLGIKNSAITDFYVKRLANDSCKSLIAISDCTAQIQMSYIEKAFPKYADKIRHKLTRIYPPQRVQDLATPKDRDRDELRFILVGHQFFGKGGWEVLQVFDNLFPAHQNLRLTIVSSLETDNYASVTGIADQNRALALIAKWPERITHFKRLPNREVLQLFASSDVALLPTYAETFGYSVLEAQSFGVPVITTDIRALPEINNNEVGWIIEVPKDEYGYGILGSTAQRSAFSQSIVAGLKTIVLNILSGAGKAREKGQKARARIIQHHSPDTIASLVREHYQKALS